MVVLIFSPLSLWGAPIYFPETEGDGRLLDLKSEYFSLGGELETEFLVPEGDLDSQFAQGDQSVFHTNQERSTFRLDKLTFIPEFHYKDQVKFYAELEAYTDRSETEKTIFREAHISFFFPYHLFLKLGLDDRLISPEFMAQNGAVGENKRLTDVYPINGISFWEDEDLGLTAGGDHPIGTQSIMYWRASLTNGLNLAHDELTRNQIYPIVHDDRDISNINIDVSNNKEWMWGLGWKHHFSDVFSLNAFGFLMEGKLAQRDVTFLKDVIRGYGSTDRDNHFWGVNLELIWRRFNLFSQYMKAKDGELERVGSYIQPSLIFSTEKRKFFNAIRFLYRFNFLNTHVDGIEKRYLITPFLWDRETHTVAMNFQIYPFLLLKNEFHLNFERPKKNSYARRVSNNEFLSQLELRF